MATEQKVAPTPREPAPLLIQTRDAGLGAVICAALWQLRHQLPDMTLAIELDQVEKFQAALEYNGQKPKLQVTVTHSIMALSMVDAKTGNGIVQSESTEADLQAKEQRAKIRQVASEVPGLVAEQRSMAARGEDSESVVRDLCDAAMLLARALR